MQNHPFRKLALSTAVSAAAFWAVGSASAQDAGQLNEIFDEAGRINQAAQQSQQTIDGIAGETSKLFQDYKSLLKEIEGLKAYNAQQERVIQSQRREMSNLEDSIARVDAIKRQITPLMLRMIDGLENFVRLDVPFLLDERTERVDGLKELMDASDVAESEKFRRVLESYQIENEYGRTIEAYRNTLSLDGVDTEVDFLRVGRVVLAYQTIDGTRSGFWNKESNSWQALPADFNAAIQEGLRIAKRQTSSNIVRLPVLAPEQAQ